MKIPVTTCCPQSCKVNAMVKQGKHKNISTGPSVSISRRPTYQIIVRGRLTRITDQVPGTSLIETSSTIRWPQHVQKYVIFTITDTWYLV